MVLIAQEENNLAEEQNNYLRINFLAPGFGGEFQFGHLQTIMVSVNLDISFGISYFATNSSSGSETYFNMSPGLHAQYRYFFNREIRLAKGRSVYNNTGYFAGIQASFGGKEIVSTNNNYYLGRTFAGGPVIGFQKTFKNNFQLCLSTGFGIIKSQYHGNYYKFGRIRSFCLSNHAQKEETGEKN